MDDLISRKAALNAIDCWHIDFNSMDGAKVQTDCWRTIKELPAVDAVPVEWLREKMRGYASTLKSTELDAVVRVMEMWEKEQEAKNEAD